MNDYVGRHRLPEEHSQHREAGQTIAKGHWWEHFQLFTHEQPLSTPTQEDAS